MNEFQIGQKCFQNGHFEKKNSKFFRNQIEPSAQKIPKSPKQKPWIAQKTPKAQMKILQPKQSLKSPVWAEKPKSGNTAYYFRSLQLSVYNFVSVVAIICCLLTGPKLDFIAEKI